MAAVAFLSASAPERSFALKDIEAGLSPPNFSLAAIEGGLYSTDYFSGSGGAIVFWSTWSPRSAEVLEDFKRYHETYGPQGLRILAVNIDGENLSHEKRRTVRSYAEERDLPFPVLLDEKLGAFVSYGVMAHPSTVIISREGRISYLLGGYPLSLRAELEEEIQKILGIYEEPPPPVEPTATYIPGGGALQHYIMGLNLLTRDQPGRALHAFGRALDRDPDFLEPAVMSARVRLAGGDIEAAEELLHGADLTIINRNDLRYILGIILLKKDKVDSAKKQFLALQRKSPGENWGYWGLAMIHLARGDYFEALEQLRSAPEKDVSSPELESTLRDHLVGRWQKGKSVEWETGFLELFPSLQDIRNRYRFMFATSAGDE